MAPTLTSFILLVALCCCLVHGSGDVLTFATFQERVDASTSATVSRLGKRQTTEIDTKLGASLYWFGNFSVGDSHNLKLLVDTGSTDLLLNPGVYKPSNYSHPYVNKTFETGYEGVNRKGFGFEYENGTLHVDNVTSGGLTVTNQVLGTVTSFRYADISPLPYADQGQGIIGFAGPEFSAFRPRAQPWFFNLCKEKKISECTLGLAFGTSGKGLLTMGKVAKNLIKGSLVSVPQIHFEGQIHSYTVVGDVTIDNKIVVTDQKFDMDVGTNNIQGPIDIVTEIYKKLHWTGVLTTKKSMKVLDAYFECNKPPVLGFSFPPQSELKKGEKATIFNVSPKVWTVFDHGDNNCTSILGGTNFLNKPSKYWLLGQSFFAGHYINFDIDKNTLGYGDLEDPSMSDVA